jgi:ribosomal protein S18 acetylase RimI-like enzyme
MEISVRKATADDYIAWCNLYDELDAWHRHHLPHLFQKPAGPVREEDYYIGLLADEDGTVFVAQAGEELVGFVHVAVMQAPDIPVFVPRRYASVDSVVVKQGFQNHGVGKLLMDAMQAWAVEQGATSIELNVYAFNESAIAFYEGLGYQTLSRKMSKELNEDTAAG